MIQAIRPESDVEEEQISFLLMERHVLITFSRKKGDVSTYFESGLLSLGAISGNGRRLFTLAYSMR